MRIRFVTFLIGLMVCFVFFNISAQAQDGGGAAPVSLASYPSGGAGLTDAIAKALAADIGLLDEVMALLAEANPAQQAAIGAGLGRAAKSYESLANAAVDDAAKKAALDKAEAISKEVAKSGNNIVMASFNVASGIAPAAAPAGGQAPGGGLPGGGGNIGRSASAGGSGSGGGTDSGSGSTPVATGSSGFLSSGSGGSYTGDGGGSSVSPTT